MPFRDQFTPDEEAAQDLGQARSEAIDDAVDIIAGEIALQALRLDLEPAELLALVADALKASDPSMPRITVAEANEEVAAMIEDPDRVPAGPTGPTGRRESFCTCGHPAMRHVTAGFCCESGCSCARFVLGHFEPR